MKNIKGFTLIELLIVISIIGVLTGLIISATNDADAGWFDRPEPKKTTNQVEQSTAESNHERLISQVPIPQIKDSLERRNVAKRAETFNNSDKISYVYLVSFGKVMSFHTAKGKISSLESYMNPTERLVDSNGNKCKRDWVSNVGFEPCYALSAPEIDGTYGSNPEGIFFFTTEGAYVEWNGEYMVSDQPLKLTTPPELVREIE